MSRWNLLKAALSGTKNSESSSSIHRFQGYTILSRKKILVWEGFRSDEPVIVGGDISYVSKLLDLCLPFLQIIDCAECQFVVNLGPNLNLDDAERLLAEGEALGYISSCSKLSQGENFEWTIRLRHPSVIPTMKRAEFVTYQGIPPQADSVEDNINDLLIYTRERPQSIGVSIAGLLSDLHHGVDNTGNVCVWMAESILLHTLLTNKDLRETITNTGILELGGGSTGLCGLGIAARRLASYVVITDGHPDCVANQKVCIQMNIQKRVIDTAECPVSSSLLRWQTDDPNEELANITSSSGKFDVVVASDCLFFKDFHDDLIWVLRNALVPVTGIVYLLQPRRGTTMDLFISKAAEWFEIEVTEDYSDQISAKRASYLDNNKTLADGKLFYDEDIHFPLLVTLRFKSSTVHCNSKLILK